MKIKLPYGLNNGKIVSINEVKKGLACNCICQNCKAQLIAKKGAKMAHHFSHYNSPDCGYNGETVIHKIAKDIIEKSISIKLPKVKYSKTKIVIHKSTFIPIDKVYLENITGNIRPDIIIETKGKKLLIEIKVSHGINNEKYQKIRQLDIPCIEIDARKIISKLYKKGDYFLTGIDFKEIILNDVTDKYWIYNTEENKINLLLKTYFTKLLKVSKSKETSFTYINNCPIRKRKWENTSSRIKYFATREDCRKCTYNLGQKYTEIYNIDDIPFDIKIQEAIYCIGHIGLENGNKLKHKISKYKKQINIMNK